MTGFRGNFWLLVRFWLVFNIDFGHNAFGIGSSFGWFWLAFNQFGFWDLFNFGWFLTGWWCNFRLFVAQILFSFQPIMLPRLDHFLVDFWLIFGAIIHFLFVEIWSVFNQFITRDWLIFGWCFLVHFPTVYWSDFG